MSLKHYQALLVAPDGDSVTDYQSNSISKTEELLADRGSRWFFYPYEFIIKDPLNLNGRILVAPEFFKNFENKTIRKVLKAFEKTSNKFRKDSNIDVYQYLGLVSNNLK